MNRAEIKFHAYLWALLSIAIITFYSLLFKNVTKDARDMVTGLYAAFSRVMWIMIPGSLIFYFNYCFLFPIKDKAKQLALTVISLSIVILFVVLHVVGYRSFWLSFVTSLWPVAVLFWLPFTILSAIIYIIERARSQKVLNRQILKQNAEAELALLKAQLNPHFLFNTLNNIDTLIQVDEKEKASESLIRMSEMMRYTTYESANVLVPLRDEIEYLRNYIALEMLRSSNNQLLKFQVSGEVGEVKVAPMLLIPFVENAFKHSSDKKSAFAIKVRLDVSDSSLLFTCTNKFDDSARAVDKISPGIGLQNIRRRLDLLYPGRNELIITKDLGIYQVNLSLDLNGD